MHYTSKFLARVGDSGLCIVATRKYTGWEGCRFSGSDPLLVAVVDLTCPTQPDLLGDGAGWKSRDEMMGPKQFFREPGS